MSRPRRASSTRALLGLAFFTLLFSFVLAGLAISSQSRQVRRQTQLIIEDKHHGVVVALQLKEILPRFSLTEETSHHHLASGEHDFEQTARHFDELLKSEEQLTLIYPDDLKELQELRRRFSKMLADKETLRRAHQMGQAGLALHQTLEADLSGLADACEQYARVNQDGMSQKQAILYSVSAREDWALRLGVGSSLFLGLLWAFMLARAIALPLAQLKRAVRSLPDAEHGPLPPFKAPLSSLTPSEIRELVSTFQETADLLQQLAEQRRSAQHQLEQSLDREHQLNRDLASANATLDEQVRAKTTELAEANQRLSELVTELRERDREKSSFLAAVSHELRTPLAIIKGAALTLTSLGASLAPDASRQLLSHVVEEANHLGGLVEDLLDAARMDAGSFRITAESGVELGSVIESVVRGLQPLFAARGITLLSEPAPVLPTVTADADRIRQVLRNLLENAAKYTPAGSTVRLTAEHVRPDDWPERIDLTVQDNGPGIPAELRPRLFTPFVQGAKAAGGGTGLGLAIAKQLVEAHGGQIGLDCPPAGGCTFWFWLPLDHQA